MIPEGGVAVVKPQSATAEDLQEAVGSQAQQPKTAISQQPGTGTAISQSQLRGYAVIERGEDFRTWARVTLETNLLGEVLARTNAYMELSMGLNVRQADGTWREAAPEVVLDGNRALGRGAGHEAVFAANANSRNAFQIRTPDGLWLKGRVYGLAYHDVSSGTNVLIGELKDCAGEVVGSDQVVYRDAFTELKASLRYTYKRSGISQDIVFREAPPGPEAYGLNPARTHLLVLTEFTESPRPIVTPQQWTLETEQVQDETISFGGSMRLGRGQAFELQNGVAGKRRADVLKCWQVLEGRDFLVERVAYREIRRELQALRAAEAGVTNETAAVSRKGRWFAEGTLPATDSLAATEANVAGVQLAQLAGGTLGGSAPRIGVDWRRLAATQAEAGRSFVLDWELVYITDWWEFLSGYTYLINGAWHLDRAYFEGGSIIKYREGSSLYIDGIIYWDWWTGGGQDYAWLTSVNDDTRGEVIGAYSTGTPALGDYGPALQVRAQDLAYAQTYIRDLYGSPGIIAITAGPSTVTVTPSDPIAAKGDPATDLGTFRISRSGGDWSQPLTVQIAVSGTASAPGDYTALGTSAIIPSYAGWVEVTVTPAIQGQGGSRYDSTVVLTVQSDAAYSVGTPASATVTIYDPSLPPPPAVPSPLGLVAWWRGENDALDVMGAHDGSPLNGAGYTYGQVAQGFNLDGVDAHIRVPDAAALDFTDDVMTVEAWVYPTTDATHDAIVVKWDAVGGINQRSYTFSRNVDGRVYFGVSPYGLDTGVHTVFSVGAVLKDRWTHVAGTYDGATLRLYVNGVEQGNGVPHTTGIFVGTDDLAIGGVVGGAWMGDTISPFAGQIDEVSLYDRALSGSEILAIYNAGRGGKCIPNPVANCQDVMTGKDTPITFNLSGSDACGDTLDFNTPTVTAQGGSLTAPNRVDATRVSVTYTPPSSTFAGTDGFNFTVSNCGFDSPPQTVTINVVAGPTLTTECWEHGIVLRWALPAELAGLADYFEIWRCSGSGNCTPTELYTTVDGNRRAYGDLGLQADTTYCYQVRFRHVNDCESTIAYNSPFAQIACNQICPAPCTVSRPGFDSSVLDRNDDASTGAITLPFTINFFGTSQTELFVNNNGNVTFNSSQSQYTPDTLVSLGRDILAVYWADVDTRDLSSDIVRYGTGTIAGRNAFGVNWMNVGYFYNHSDRLFSGQLVLIDRSDIASGDFDIEFNYCQVGWEAGDASGGLGGLWCGPGGSPSRAGFASAGGSSFEFVGSGIAGAFLDSNLNSGLIHNSFNSPEAGRYLFRFRNGHPLETP